MDRILVPIDGSPRASAVLSVAEALARKTGAKLILFRAVVPLTEVTEHTKPPAALEDLRREAEDYLNARARALPTEIRTETRVGVGVPWQAICDAANREDADLVVIGSHGYRGMDRLMGTTAAKIVDHATRSVLVVRNAQWLESFGGEESP